MHVWFHPGTPLFSVYLGASFGLAQALFDWFFCMSIVAGLVHFSFREIFKIQQELLEKREESIKAEIKLKHIVDNSEDAIFTVSEDGNFTFANKSIEKLTGYNADEILKLYITDIVTDKYKTFIMKQMYQSLDLAARHVYVDCKKKDGNLISVDISFIPMGEHNLSSSYFQGIAKDITELKKGETAQLEKEQYLYAVARIGQIFVESDSKIPFEEALRILSNTTSSYMSAIYFGDFDVKTKINAERIIKWNDPNYRIADVSESEIRDLIGSSAKIPENSLLSEQKRDSYLTKSNEKADALIFPMFAESKYIGGIIFFKEINTQGWRSDDINLISSGAKLISQSVEKQIAKYQLKRHFISLARTISRILFFTDPFTARHQQNVAEITCLVGEKIGLNPKRLEWMYFAGLLHDIGKAAIPGTILSKPGQLTEEEWILMRSHAKRGYEMLQEMDLPDYVVDMVMHHHERLDGSGYPEGLKSDRLSLESKILGICDVVEAMGSHRPYRPAHKLDDIIEELKNGRGIKYDENLTDLLIKMIESKELKVGELI